MTHKPRKLVGHEEQVVEMNATGHSAKDIAACFGVEAATVRRLLKSLGVVQRCGPASTLEPHTDEIVHMYQEERKTIDEIGVRFNVEGTAIWKFLQKQDVEMRSRRQIQVRHIPEIEALYGAGWSIQAIAKHLGVTYGPLYRFMVKNKIDTRPVGAHCQGEGNPRWMGAAASYGAAHDRVRKLRGTPKKCERCGTTDPRKRYEWASKTEDYLNPADYERLCKGCHGKDDNKKRRERFELTNAKDRFNTKMAEEKVKREESKKEDDQK